MSDYFEMKQYIEQRQARGLDTPELDGSEVLALIAENERMAALLECAQGDIRTADKIIAERNRLLDAIPECPVHGRCVPHAIEWVEKSILVMKEQVTEIERLDRVSQNLSNQLGSCDRERRQYMAERNSLRQAVKFSAETFERISSADGSGHADLGRAVLRIAGPAMGKGEQS